MTLLRMPILLVFQLAFFSQITLAAPTPDEDHPDRVHKLPGAPSEPVFPMYSGFLETEIKGVHHRVFYVLAEAIHADPLEAPLVVWFNGGPGASSLIGFIHEHGPYLLNADGTLRYNDFSWNQYTNVLYLESPSGVGFSHANASFGWHDDEKTAEVNMNVIEDFMTRVHPRYTDRDFFIAGESFAGNYVPFLTRAILRGVENGKFTNHQFKGIALGNAGIDILGRRLASYVQMYSMGMLPQKYGPNLTKLWQRIQDEIELNEIGNEILGIVKEIDNEFEIFAPSVNRTVPQFMYNLQLRCETGDSENIWHVFQSERGVECDLLALANLYFNREDVQKSLNVITVDNDTVHWDALKQSVLSRYLPVLSTVSIYTEIFEKANDDFRVLFYTRDLDLACPAIHVAQGTRLIAKNNFLEKMEKLPKVWNYLGDFGGVRTSYKKVNSSITLDNLTVRGAGHFVPISYPSRMFQLFNNFIFATETPIDYSEKIRRRKKA